MCHAPQVGQLPPSLSWQGCPSASSAAHVWLGHAHRQHLLHAQQQAAQINGELACFIILYMRKLLFWVQSPFNVLSCNGQRLSYA